MMKGKALLAIALIASASSSAFAMEIVKGKILEHKVWSTTNTKSVPTFKEIEFDKNRLATMLSKHKNELRTMSFAFDRMNEVPATMTVGDTADISGRAHAYIENETLDRKKYVITNEVCQDPPGSQMSLCMFSSTDLYLDAGGYISLSEQPEWKGMTFNDVGQYFVSVGTEITEEGQDVTRSYFTDDYRLITVQPAKK